MTPNIPEFFIKTENSLAHSKAFNFIMKEFVKLIDSNLVDNEIPFTNSNDVTYVISKDGEIISASVWFYNQPKRSGFILFSATKETYRNKGFYKKVYYEIEKKLIAMKAVNVYSSAAIGNTSMISIANSMNRNATFLKLKKTL